MDQNPKSLIPLVFLAVAAPASAYELLGGSFETERGPIPFHLEPSGSGDISDGSDLDALRATLETWSCIEGSRARLTESETPGDKAQQGGDGLNSIFWDEDNSFALGPSTLGVASPFGTGAAGGTEDCDIVFNGFDSSWSTDDGLSAVDVASIAAHEVGHCLGLAHPCTNDNNPATCTPAEEAIMFPVWSGTVDREPRSDDVAGLLALYPQADDDDSTCTGPFRVGEECACNDECAKDWTCVAQADGRNLCVNQCDSENPDACGPGFNCVLAAAPDDESPAPGKCVAAVPGEPKPIGATCDNLGFACGPDRDCVRSGAAGDVEVCFAGCQEDTDCPDGYACEGILCLLDEGAVSIQCPSPEPEPEGDGQGGCGCDAFGSVADRGAVALLFLVLFRRPQRRRAPPSRLQ